MKIIKNRILYIVSIWGAMGMGNIQAQMLEHSARSNLANAGVYYGKLSNGFSYYIKPVKGYHGKTAMELVVRAGATFQAEDQLDMAHFLEHMPLVHTGHFVNILKNTTLLSDLKMQIKDIRGRTGGDRTVFSFDHMADNTKALDTGLLFFKDIASGKIVFDKKDVDGERGAFFQEYVAIRNANHDNTIKAISKLSNAIKGYIPPQKYHQYIQQFKIRPLQRFYKQWYHPDRMAVLLTGDIKEVRVMVQKIKNTFGAIPQHGKAPEYVDFKEEYLQREHQWVCFKDVFNTTQKQWSMQFFLRKLPHRYKGAPEIVYEWLDELLLTVMKKRINEALTGYQQPYQVVAGSASFLPAIKITVNTSAAYKKQAVQKAFGVVNGLRENGVTNKEWESTKKMLLERWNTEDTLHTQYWMRKMEDDFVRHRRAWGDTLTLAKKYVSELTSQTFNSFIKHSLPKGPQDIVVIVPVHDQGGRVNDQMIRNWVQTADTLRPAAKQNRTVKPLLANEDKAKLREQKYKDMGVDALGAHTYVLHNGVRLIVKSFLPAAGRYQHKVMLHGFTPFGAMNLPKEDFYNAVLAPEMIRYSGAGGWNKFELEKKLDTTALAYNMRCYIEAYESGIKAEIEEKNLETALQLIYLYTAKPRWDTVAFEAWKKQEYKGFVNSYGSVRMQNDFLNGVQQQLGAFPPLRNSSLRWEVVKGLEMQKAFDAYKVVLQNPEHFTFIVTGNYDLKKALPLLIKYLGNIPVADNNSLSLLANSRKPQSPKTPYKKRFISKMPVENVYVHQTYLRPHHQGFNRKDQLAYQLLTYILNTKIQDLRYQKKRGVYLSGARYVRNIPEGYQFINLIVKCERKDMALVENDLFEMVNTLKKNGVSKEMFTEAMQSYMIPLYSSASLNRNLRVQRQLYEHYRYQLPWYNQSEINQSILNLNRDSIPAMAKKYLRTNFLMDFTAQSDTAF
ncbi:M16 family metallopeptidase [Zhouia sp. PK063]|uniref:M16 family metallopeptidase n=1 Tax=Zhouia sp. PK063 TaxID=3373602 RepID=UPI0037923CA4